MIRHGALIIKYVFVVSYDFYCHVLPIFLHEFLLALIVMFCETTGCVLMKKISMDIYC